jgi:hypothetical protein
MQHEHYAFEPYGVDRSIRAPIPILDNLQDASGAEAFEGLGLLMLLAILGKVKSISKEVFHRAGQGKQVPFRVPYPVQRLQGRRFVHLRSLYLHWYNVHGKCRHDRCAADHTEPCPPLRTTCRLGFAPDFAAFANAGRELARLHVEYESLPSWPLQEVETKGVPYSQHVVKMKLSPDKLSLYINDSLTLAGIPPEVFDYRLGSRSALEWVIDQYRVKGESDPNREDDPG